MKFLVIGLGSMGKRRIRNLLANNETDIIGFDLRQDRCCEAREKYGIQTCDSIEKVLSIGGVNAFIISVPPDKHMVYANLAYENNIHCFIEASVVDDGMEELITKLEGKPELRFCPSCTLRFHPSIKLIKRIITNGELGKLSNFSYHSGQYLPDWHPWEDISEFYVSKKETGGCREIVPFELTWLNWIFGKVQQVSGFNAKTIPLNADIDDVYAIAMKYDSGIIGTLLVDVVSRVAVRRLVINGDKGQISWDWDKKCVDFYDSEDKRFIHYEEPIGVAESGYNQNIIENMYVDEIESFIDEIHGRNTFSNCLKDDYEILQILYKAEKSGELI